MKEPQTQSAMHGDDVIVDIEMPIKSLSGDESSTRSEDVFDDGVIAIDEENELVLGDNRDEEKQQQELEVSEIHRKTQKETARVRRWRYATAMLLLGTAVAVTWSTYHFLAREEYQNFEIAYEQFARTVGEAAIRQQNDLRDAIAALSNSLSVSAENNNVTWPYFYPPKFQLYAEDFMKISSAEYAGLNVIVTHDQRDKFIEYSTQQYEAAVKESHMMAYGNLDRLNQDPDKYNAFISRKDENGIFVPDIERDYYSARTAYSPPPPAYGPTINTNIGAIGKNADLIASALALGNETLVSTVKPFQAVPAEEHALFHLDDPKGIDYPHSFFYFPVRKVPKDYSSTIVATINVAHAWDVSMRKLLPKTVNGIVAVLRNNCGQVFSFVIDGHDVLYLGEDDTHDDWYDKYELEVDLTPHTHPNFPTSPGHCMYSLHIFPSDAFKEAYNSNMPKIFAAGVAILFVAVAIVFLGYDSMVKRRNEKLVKNAAQSNALVSNLFPANIKERVMDERNQRTTDRSAYKHQNLRTFLSSSHIDKHENSLQAVDRAKTPLADLFPETTVMFADLVGFTSWSSAREPSQVFTLLETVYGTFDKSAKKRKVFKVETIGDCYVAVTGLPEPMADHAVTMARFASNCLNDLKIVSTQLEAILGPGTRELMLRVGLHSGSVIAGVLRGERQRFQLYGDTMNTAARMESTSEPGRIQLSHETAQLLLAAKKDRWIEKREVPVLIKGKGELQTYWCTLPKGGSKGSGSFSYDETRSCTQSVCSEESRWDRYSPMDEAANYLIEWNTGMLAGFIQQIIARRNANGKIYKPFSITNEKRGAKAAEIIDFPKLDAAAIRKEDAQSVEVPEEVTTQLKSYIAVIAQTYQREPFHSFDHASHVATTAVKLMSRVVTNTAFEDPLIRFAMTFAGMVIDVGHRGASNSVLLEQANMRSKEVHSTVKHLSFEKAWELFIDGPYDTLRETLFANEAEMTRFRQVVINAILATDLCDDTQRALCNRRWDRAYSVTSSSARENEEELVNRKSTALVEHLMQAASIGHTMQDWQVYRKWDERLFEEIYTAHKAGRGVRNKGNPAEYWYDKELEFFDSFVIPLAQKLKNSGVFAESASNDEYLKYATRNREMWEQSGRSTVTKMVQEVEKKLIR